MKETMNRASSGAKKREKRDRTAAIYVVKFRQPPVEDDSRTEFYFTSLAAIYEVFSREQVGCSLRRLWNVRITEDSPYRGRLCEITKEKVRSKAQKSPARGFDRSSEELPEVKK